MSRLNQGAVAIGSGAPGALTIWRTAAEIFAAIQLSATGSSAAIPAPAGVCAGDVQAFVSGGPTAVAAVIEGSTDGVTWTQLPLPSTTLAGPIFTSVRLRLAALAGGTSPTVTIVGFATQ